MLSMTTDYATSKGCAEPYLERIAAAGFTHVHWCHQWCTDFAYCDAEIKQVAAWLDAFGLRLLDLHGSATAEKHWSSSREYERLAGVELVANRIRMAARLGGDVVIMHFRRWEPDAPADDPRRVQLRKSLDELTPLAAECGVRIAVENMGGDDFFAIRELLGAYGPDYLGLCYDSGHGNIAPGRGLDHLDSVRDRLISVHLHDNNGTGDQHNLPFTGTVDWPRLAGILAGSSYAKPLSFETTVGEAAMDEELAFLAKAFEAGAKLTDMVGGARVAAG